ncbi:S41 family peptidase [Rhodomicrobium lacus]|uniref:S41 family peptidase n=1 Tax=Rhodomicrobium lacus TaxID=2498452 RepID=UPI0013DFA6E9|nr:S41 family peptidase [Rhodomicrobium lacus]
MAALFLFAATATASGEVAGVARNGTRAVDLRPLELFGIALQRIRTAYVDKVDDSLLLKNAVLGVTAASPVMQEHPATKKALRRLDDGTQDTKSKLQVFGDFLVAARGATSETLDKLSAAAIEGMLKGLDSRSKYVTPKEMQDMQVRAGGSTGGLGIELKIEDGIPKVITPVENAPADRAGVLAGDTITHIDGASLRGLTLVEAVEKMRGPVGSTVLLTIARNGSLDPIQLSISRDIVRIHPVRYRIEGDVAYININTFQSANIYEYLKQAIDDLKRTAGPKLKGYVIDLRNNSGGLLDQAVKVAGAFIESGTVVLEQGRSSTERKEASGGDLAEGRPIVVLINKNTASGAEIVASNLQDEHRATLVGRRTFGAGTVQTLFRLDDERAIRLTTHRLLRANGQSLDGKGVEPDVVVDAASELPAKGQYDPDLAAALDILRKQ